MSQRRPGRLPAGRTWGIAALAVSAMLSACARPKPVAGRSGGREVGAPAVPTQVSAVIDNRGWADLVVLLTRDGQSTRIGTVTATTKATLRFPSKWVLGSARLELVARAIGGRGSLRSESFVMRPDQHIEWTVEDKLARATLAIY